MNIHPFFVTFFELLLVLTFFVFPSFSSKPQSFISFSYMTITIVYSFLSTLCIITLHKKKNFFTYMVSKKTFSLKKIPAVFFAFVLLTAASFLFSLFAQGEVFITLERASGPHHYAILLLWIFCLSFFEESLYRFYLPDTFLKLLIFFPAINNKATHHLFYYGIPILLFSLAHSYNGIYGILFAAVSCIFFFMLKKKYNSLLLNSIVHCAYNVFSLYLMQKSI